LSKYKTNLGHNCAYRCESNEGKEFVSKHKREPMTIILLGQKKLQPSANYTN